MHCWNLKTLELTRVLEGQTRQRIDPIVLSSKTTFNDRVGANGIMYVRAKVYEESGRRFNRFPRVEGKSNTSSYEDEFDIKDEEEKRWNQKGKEAERDVS